MIHNFKQFKLLTEALQDSRLRSASVEMFYDPVVARSELESIKMSLSFPDGSEADYLFGVVGDDLKIEKIGAPDFGSIEIVWENTGGMNIDVPLRRNRMPAFSMMGDKMILQDVGGKTLLEFGEDSDIRYLDLISGGIYKKPAKRKRGSAKAISPTDFSGVPATPPSPVAPMAPVTPPPARGGSVLKGLRGGTSKPMSPDTEDFSGVPVTPPPARGGSVLKGLRGGTSKPMSPDTEDFSGVPVTPPPARGGSVLKGLRGGTSKPMSPDTEDFSGVPVTPPKSGVPSSDWRKSVSPKSEGIEPGTFKKSAEEIASTLLGAAEGDASSAVRKARFYMNRAGSNLSSVEREKMEEVIRILKSGETPDSPMDKPMKTPESSMPSKRSGGRLSSLWGRKPAEPSFEEEEDVDVDIRSNIKPQGEFKLDPSMNDFDLPGEKLAEYILSNSKNVKHAINRLSFYGSTRSKYYNQLSPMQMSNIEDAITHLREDSAHWEQYDKYDLDY